MKLIHRHIVNAVPPSAVELFEFDHPLRAMQFASLDRDLRARSQLTNATIRLMRGPPFPDGGIIGGAIITGVRDR